MSGKLVQVTGWVSHRCKQKLKIDAHRLRIPATKVLAMLIDNAFEAGITCDMDLTLPEITEDLEGLYAKESSKFLDYMNSLNKGMGLDDLLLARHDMDIDDREVFLHVFKECLTNTLIRPVTPRSRYIKVFPKGYKHYVIARDLKVKNKVSKKKADRYEEYLKLRNEFEKEGEV